MKIIYAFAFTLASSTFPSSSQAALLRKRAGPSSERELQTRDEDTIKAQNLDGLILNGFQPNRISDGLKVALQTVPLFDESLLEHCPTTYDARADSSTFLSESLEEMTTLSASSFGVEFNGRAFSAGVESEFSHSGASTRSSKLLKFSMTYEYATQRMTKTNDGLRDFLTAAAKSYLDGSSEPRKVFEQLGPYYVASLQFGGEYQFYSSTESTAEFSATEFKTAVFGSRRGVEGEATFSHEVTVGNTNVAISGAQTVVGGNPIDFKFVATTNPSEWVQQETAWIESVPGALEVVDVQLKPIYELASDPARREELKTEFTRLYSTSGRTPNEWDTSLYNGSGPKPNGSNLVSDGPLTINGSFYKSSYNLFVNGDLHINGSFYKNTGRVIVNGNIHVNGSFYKNGGEIQIPTDKNYYVTGSTYKNTNFQKGFTSAKENYDVDEFYAIYIQPNLPETKW